MEDDDDTTDRLSDNDGDDRGVNELAAAEGGAASMNKSHETFNKRNLFALF